MYVLFFSFSQLSLKLLNLEHPVNFLPMYPFISNRSIKRKITFRIQANFQQQQNKTHYNKIITQCTL